MRIFFSFFLASATPAMADSLTSPSFDPATLATIVQQAAPVTSVNAKTGNVTVPVLQRQSSPALDATSGVVSWHFPIAFTTVPTCYESLVSPSTTFTFDKPVITAISATDVTEVVTAHPSSLSVTAFSLPVALPLKAAPPAGTTITLTCTANAP